MIIPSAVRQLTGADLEACTLLAVDRDWEPAPEKWRLLFELGEVYGIDGPDGGLAGAVALTRYGPGLAAVGKMLVARRHERQGLGGRLMRHVLDRAGDTVTCLIATDYGRPLYERLGFRVIDRSVRYIGPFQGTGASVRPATAADLAGIGELDRRSFGADRGALLAALPRVAGRFVVSDGPAVRGFAAAWPADDLLTIGPVVADEPGVATALIAGLAAGADRPVRLDLPGRHPGLGDWVAGRGLTVRRESAYMVRGGELPGVRENVFAPANMALC